jgi:hypothetical protein
MATEHRVREALETFMARVRHDLDAHTRGLTTDLLRLYDERQEYWRAEIDKAVEEARSGAERSFRTRLEAQRNELARDFEVRVAAERAEMLSSTSMKSSVHGERAEALARLLAAVRRIDESTSLTGILEALARAAAAETSRVAVLLVDGDTLRSWGHFGYTAGQGPFDMPLGEIGVLAATVALRQTSFVPPAVAGREAVTPAFMRVTIGHTGLVVPIIVGNEVVAVLYADDVGRREEQEDAPIWTEEVDLLVRHAALRLENVTSVRTVEVLTK